jgi:hypothetical protein
MTSAIYRQISTNNLQKIKNPLDQITGFKNLINNELWFFNPFRYMHNMCIYLVLCKQKKRPNRKMVKSVHIKELTFAVTKYKYYGK